jgi:hypothetical protein
MLCGGSVHDPPFEQLVCFLRLQHLSPVSLSVNSVDISSIALEIAQFSRPEFKSQNLILYIAAYIRKNRNYFIYLIKSLWEYCLEIVATIPFNKIEIPKNYSGDTHQHPF